MRNLGLAAVLTFVSLSSAQETPVHGNADAAALGLQRLPAELGTLSGITAMPTPDSCPVDLAIRLHPSAPMLLASSAGSFHPTYGIDLRSTAGKRIREVAVELFGPTGPHLEKTGTGGTGDAREGFVLTRLTHSLVSTRTLTAVRWMDVLSVTYADGTTWRKKSGSDCRVVPQSVFLLQ